MKDILALLFAICFCGVSASEAEVFPSKPIRLVVPFPAGGPTDLHARMFAKQLASELRTVVVVDNRSGGSGIIGSLIVKNSAADGYTLLFGTASTTSLYNLMSRAPKYQIRKDFRHIAVLGGSPVVFVGRVSGTKMLGEAIELSRKRPDTLTYASPGQGTYLHLAFEWLKVVSGGVLIRHIPYKGSAETVPALLGGHVDLLVDTLGSAMPYHHTRQLYILAVASTHRSDRIPGVATVNEALGLETFEASLWNILSAPSGLDEQRYRLLVETAKKINNTRRFILELEASGIVMIDNVDPLTFIDAENKKWQPIVHLTGVTLP